MSNVYVADFETTTKAEDCRVWGWGLYNIYDDEFSYDNNIRSFMNSVLKLPRASRVYFHNLKFDGSFIIYELFKMGFKHTQNRKLKNGEFSSLITDRDVFYSITLKWNSKLYYFYDSLKIMPLSVKNLSKAFGIALKKGDIDYELERPVGWKITDNELEYIKNDVVIVGQALKYFFDQDLTKMTQASNAFYDFKSTMSEKAYNRRFPVLSFDKALRQSYKGGWTYVREKFKNKIIKKGIVFDVNSLYPWVMRYKKLPYGEPIYFDGEYKEDKLYVLYIQQFRCTFKLKKGKLPTIQLKNSPSHMPTEYAKDSNGEMPVLTLTNIDLELFFENYEVKNIEWFGGWKFKSTDKIFIDYIDKWIEVKNKASIEKNEGLRTIAKLMLNALYGRFALNPEIQSKFPVWDGDIVQYVKGDPDTRDPVYLPMASFITAYARDKTIRTAQANYERFIYADTDSLHLTGHEMPDIEVDPVLLGAWKEEYKFVRGKFLRAKAYCEELEDKTLHIACAGLPHRCHVAITFENFREGFEIKAGAMLDGEKIGKLAFKRVKGGAILVDRDYKIKGLTA